MKFRIEIGCIADDLEEVRPIASLERTDVAPETLGLTLAEGKAILKTIQEAMIEQPLARYVASQRRCPDCGAPRPTAAIVASSCGPRSEIAPSTARAWDTALAGRMERRPSVRSPSRCPSTLPRSSCS